MRIVPALLTMALLAACAGSGDVIVATPDSHADPVAAADGPAPPVGGLTGHPTSRLVEFRDAAADALYWLAVDWEPPTTVADVTQLRDAVVQGTLVEAVLPDEPRAWDLEPYDGAPTIYQLEVLLRVLDEGGRNHTVRVPVLSSVAERLSLGDEAARRITSLAPVGADVLLVSGEHGASVVAMEADDGSLVGYYSSLDDLAGSHTLDSLRAAIEAELSG